MIAPENPVTIGEYFTFLADSHWEQDVLDWPPDVFCLLAALLQKTGGYIRLVSDWPPATRADDSTPEKNIIKWQGKIEKAGREWWRHASNALAPDMRTTPPDKIGKWWKIVCDNRDLKIDELAAGVEKNVHREFWRAVFQLCAAADEACIGIGVAHRSEHRNKLDQSERPPRDFLYRIRRQLDRQIFKEQPSTLTRHIRSSFAAVLPKFHTPQSGITLRSISHNLAFLRASEVTPYFYVTGTEVEPKQKAEEVSRHSLNLLLLPWPMRICPADFLTVPSKKQVMDRGFGFFSYKPDIDSSGPAANTVDRLRDILEQAERETGHIDGVVFPELALSETQLDEVFGVIKGNGRERFMIAGVGSAGTKDEFGTNKAVFRGSLGASPDTIEQHKHHRWQLTRSQIEQYGLGSQLDPTRAWWEHIGIRSRQLSLISITDRIALSVLICEDLARQDPISDIIRAVGPNLVVALLMDGPQLKGRWPAHYATVFAEDPGSSVLTFTSLGMTELSRPADSSVCRVVGLWRDKFGGFRQIELEPKSEGVVLSLTVEEAKEWTADGREDKNDSSYLRLNGIRQIRKPERRAARGNRDV
jgi:hypothetical protein